MKGKPWRGRVVVVTSGPTREPLDPVRFLTNPSSGRMGFSLAAAARELGARVRVVSGPTALPDPSGVRVRRVMTALQMRKAALSMARGADVFIGAAAVGDWRFARVSPHKIKRDGRGVTLRLLPNPDIIREVARSRRRPPLVVGFALESRDWLANAAAKLRAKGLDAVVANRVDSLGAASGRFAVLLADGRRRLLPRGPKLAAARAILGSLAADVALPPKGSR